MFAWALSFPGGIGAPELIIILVIILIMILMSAMERRSRATR